MNPSGTRASINAFIESNQWLLGWPVQAAERQFTASGWPMESPAAGRRLVCWTLQGPRAFVQLSIHVLAYMDAASVDAGGHSTRMLIHIHRAAVSHDVDIPACRENG